jgi:hypothetical protein
MSKLGKAIASEGRITIWETDDRDTPYIVSLGSGTATLNCVMGEGEVEGEELTDAEFELAMSVAHDLEEERQD